MTSLDPRAQTGAAPRYLLGAVLCMMAGLAATWLIVGRQTTRVAPGPARHEVVFEAPTGEPTYRNAALGFAFSAPPGWTPADTARHRLTDRLVSLPEGVETVAFELAGSSADLRHIHVMVQKARLPLEAITPDDLAEAARRIEATASQHGMRTCKVLEADAIYVNGLHGARIEYTADLVALPHMSQPSAVRVMHVHLKAEARVYAIAFSAAEDTYASCRDAFNRSLASFRVSPPDPPPAASQPRRRD